MESLIKHDEEISKNQALDYVCFCSGLRKSYSPQLPFLGMKNQTLFFPKGETLDSATRDAHILLVSLWFSFSAGSKVLLSLLRHGDLVLAISISSRNLQGQVYFKNYLWAAQRSGPFCRQGANRSV